MKAAPIISYVKNNQSESIIGGIVLLVVLLVIIRQLKNIITGVPTAIKEVFEDEDIRELTDSQKSGIDKIHVKSSNINRPDLFYNSIVSELYFAMQGAQIGRRFTREDIDALGLLNADELKKIVKLFGIRRKRPLDGWLSDKLPDKMQGGIVGNLIDWFKDELSGSELKEMQNIFQKTGLWL